MSNDSSPINIDPSDFNLTVSPVRTGVSFEFAYSKLARHISAARCLQEGLDDMDLSTREKSLLEQIREAYEFIELFEKMMTTVQVETAKQSITTEDLKHMFPRPVSMRENFDATRSIADS